MIELEQHTAGELAYLDTFSGLIPCKVLKVITPAPCYMVTAGELEIKLTATRGAYRKGEVLTSRSHGVIPRTSVRVRCGQYRIRNNYKWVASS